MSRHACRLTTACSIPRCACPLLSSCQPNLNGSEELRASTAMRDIHVAFAGLTISFRPSGS
eukprot:8087193-Alexandrium_andersonii.AAC.1